MGPNCIHLNRYFSKTGVLDLRTTAAGDASAATELATLSTFAGDLLEPPQGPHFDNQRNRSIHFC